MGHLIDRDQIAAFERDGAVCVRGAFSMEWIEIVRAGIERNMRDPSRPTVYVDGEARRFFQDSDNWRRIPEFKNFALNSPARVIAGQLLKSNKINFLHDHVLVKEPDAAKKTLWHQDQPYSPVDGWQFCTMWLPVDAVPRQTALEFVAGSHNARRWYRPRRFLDGTLRVGDDPRWTILPDIDDRREHYPIIGWALELGDCLVFHGLTLHGAPGNSQKMRRRVLSTRWTGDDATFARRTGEMSPRPPEVGAPKNGEIMDCDAFPVVWRRDEPL
jgi:ectoine hydroxylase-related dioxygenase (phytanoyl-CoA dioxygenase family)